MKMIRSNFFFGIFFVTMACCTPACIADPCQPPKNLRAVFSETSIECLWDSVNGATGYNLYDLAVEPGKKNGRRKINALPITSGTRFSYIWDIDKGEMVKRIKGYSHRLVATALFDDCHESGPSNSIDNSYFERYKNVLTPQRIAPILSVQQRTLPLPTQPRAMTRQQLTDFLGGPGSQLATMVKKQINPQKQGACSPISTILVRLLAHHGLDALKAEGTFIKEYHSFVLLVVDSVEYVLDFTADQFVPNVAPVLIPRDRCFINDVGRLDSTGQPVYLISRLYSVDQTSLADNPSGKIYSSMLTEIVQDSISPKPGRQTDTPRPTKKTSLKKIR